MSIIIPVFNGHNFILNCLRSIENQDNEEVEVIVVNDGSTDDTKNIVENAIFENITLKMINQSNKGVSSARNTGIREARGKYLLFLDADDTLIPNILFETKKILVQHNPDLILGKISSASQSSLTNDKTKRIDMNIAVEKVLNGETGGYLGCKIFKRNISKEVMFDKNINICEDLYFTLLFLLRSNKIFWFKEPLYNYTQRVDSISHSFSNLIDENNNWKYVTVISKIQEKFHKYPVAEKYIYRTLISYEIDGIITLLSHPDNYLTLKKLRYQLRKEIPKIFLKQNISFFQSIVAVSLAFVPIAILRKIKQKIKD